MPVRRDRVDGVGVRRGAGRGVPRPARARRRRRLRAPPRRVPPSDSPRIVRSSAARSATSRRAAGGGSCGRSRGRSATTATCCWAPTSSRTRRSSRRPTTTAPASRRSSTATSSHVVNRELDADFEPTPSTTWRSSTASASGSRCACAPGARPCRSGLGLEVTSPPARSCARRSARSSRLRLEGDLAAAGLELQAMPGIRIALRLDSAPHCVATMLRNKCGQPGEGSTAPYPPLGTFETERCCRRPTARGTDPNGPAGAVHRAFGEELLEALGIDGATSSCSPTTARRPGSSCWRAAAPPSSAAGGRRARAVRWVAATRGLRGARRVRAGRCRASSCAPTASSPPRSCRSRRPARCGPSCASRVGRRGSGAPTT